MKRIIKRLTKAHYDDIFSLSEFAFQYKLSPSELEEKKAEAARHIIWGWMEHEEIAAKLHLIPLESYILGKTFHMGGISSVATWPEYRRQGMVKHLLYHALTYMKEHGQMISFLHPFAFAFYRKYGWEHTFSQKKYTIPLSYLRKHWDVDGYVRRIQDDLTPLKNVYDDYAKRYTGPLVRDDKWWKQRILNKPNNIAVAYQTNERAEGYILYDVNHQQMTVKELAYRSLDGLKLLLQFISHHDSMAKKVTLTVPENDHLSLLLDEPTFDQQLIPYFMARIVDVHSFLEDFPFNKGLETSLRLHIEDTFFPCNSGVYHISPHQEQLHVTFMRANDIQKKDENRIYLDIQSLTSMFLGFQRPLELYAIGRIHGAQTAINVLDQLIPKQQPYFPDFF